ncbi:NADH-quinone oxidoreductase subunit C [Caldithrix abyssi]|uniref:NADH-quinone oxidoreductase subunit C n=1 Tax=Caldithrix abyssi DSM 13497 TaxID=880073 RepID=H1XQ49_CALAY|nr:NADH-quinone oxidoreductase subunit C [Caldithrix abyssi]APF18278.1 nuoC NADH dehydrogenase subunit C [Caldithrix abyssi DSM 13497]EHO42300.1 NAD(P)H-quinone oxidoreductase subunit J [Caldithrix abyssi DSM 13497]
MEAKDIFQKLKERFGEAILELNDEVLQPFIKIAPDKTNQIAQFLRDEDDLKFDFLMCLSGVDLGENLGVVYHLYSMKLNHKIVLKTEVSKEKPDVHTVANIWRTADWHEREAYDLLGIHFVDHPDLRRILLPEDWEGHPLRKDYKPPKEWHGIPVTISEEEENDSVE